MRQGLGALSLWLLGYPEQAASSVRQALSLAEHLSHAPSLAHAMLWDAMCHQFRREPKSVLSCGESLVAIASEQGLALYTAAGIMMRGWALTHQGETAEGIAEIRRGLDAYAATGTKLMAAYFKTMLAETCVRGGDAEVGLTVLEEALRLTDETGERFWEAGMLHLKGELLRSASTLRRSEAEECYQQALAVAQRQRAKSLELRISTSLARLWQARNEHTRAHALLALVYGWFTEGFDTPDLIDAKRLLDQLEQNSPVCANAAI
jgi:predicted ATPase